MRIEIVRFAEPAQPGWVECRLVDAYGREHRFLEKVPVVSKEALDAGSDYPVCGVLACTVLDRRPGSAFVEIDTATPWGVVSTEGISRFWIAADQLVELVEPGSAST